MRKKARANSKYSKGPVSLILIILLALSLYIFVPKIIAIWKINREIQAMELKKSQLRSQNDQYIEKIQALKSKDMVEKMAREELGMIKPGEKVIVPVDSERANNQ
ncbi:MAG: FtsB family cell division protein [Chitinophagales bacterium]